MTQLLLHLWGDYILQSQWMATNKTKNSLAALAHCLAYSAGFWLLHPSLIAWLIIFGTHFFIDRFRLARYVVWAKNWIGPWSVTYWEQRMSWKVCSGTGYVSEDRGGPPAWMQVWLLIIADNTLHLTINFLALKYL